MYTIKTYALEADPKKLSFILSFANTEETEATLTLMAKNQSLTVELNKDSLQALAASLHEALYANPASF